MDNDLSIVTQTIIGLLSELPQQSGSRLKQNLKNTLTSKGVASFNEKQHGYKGFANFLEETLSGSVTVVRPEGSGDVLISLKRNSESSNKKQSISHDSQQSIIRSEIWQAFTNPDLQRKRFFDKSTLQICHFSVNLDSDQTKAVESNKEKYIEIEPIDGSLQNQWMKSFLESTKLSPADKKPLESLLEETYSSALNATFKRALGSLGDEWKKYRTENIVEIISNWANNHRIPFEQLLIPPPISNQKNDVNVTKPFSHRQHAIQLLNLISEEEILKNITPVLLDLYLNNLS